MLTSRADGTYPGKIVSAYVAEDGWEKGEYVLKIDVNLEGGGAVTCRQPLKDSEKTKRGSVLRELGFSYPFKSSDLLALAGQAIDVNLKTSAKGNQNAYVAVVREERVLTPEEIDALGDPADLPF